MSKIKCNFCDKVYNTDDYETPEDFITEAEEHRDTEHKGTDPMGQYLVSPASREKYPRTEAP